MARYCHPKQLLRGLHNTWVPGARVEYTDSTHSRSPQISTSPVHLLMFFRPRHVDSISRRITRKLIIFWDNDRTLFVEIDNFFPLLLFCITLLKSSVYSLTYYFFLAFFLTWFYCKLFKNINFLELRELKWKWNITIKDTRQSWDIGKLVCIL